MKSMKNSGCHGNRSKKLKKSIKTQPLVRFQNNLQKQLLGDQLAKITLLTRFLKKHGRQGAWHIFPYIHIVKLQTVQGNDPRAIMALLFFKWFKNWFTPFSKRLGPSCVTLQTTIRLHCKQIWKVQDSSRRLQIDSSLNVAVNRRQRLHLNII